MIIYLVLLSVIQICVDGEYPPCVLPDPPQQGKYVIIESNATTPVAGSSVQHGTILYFVCKPSTMLKGGDVAVCYKGKWLGGLPVCTAKENCVIPKPLEHGYYTMVGSTIPPVEGSPANERDTLIFACQDKYQLVGQAYSTCLKGKWSIVNSFCAASKGCDLTKYPTNGRYTLVATTMKLGVGQHAPESTVLEFSCEDSYYMVGERAVYCKNRSWSSAFPKCLIIKECSHLPTNSSGVYFMKPSTSIDEFAAYCDANLNGRPWTVILSRINGLVDFNRNYYNYTHGFGSPYREYWLGLERIHQLTADNPHELLVDITYVDGKNKYAQYGYFSVGSSYTGFKLSISNYSGNAGNALESFQGTSFSTYDHQHGSASANCINVAKGGWWAQNCLEGNLNGVYKISDAVHQRMQWMPFSAPIKAARMLVRMIAVRENEKTSSN